eukprot:2423702-Rhodomonas_salina.1
MEGNLPFKEAKPQFLESWLQFEPWLLGMFLEKEAVLLRARVAHCCCEDGIEGKREGGREKRSGAQKRGDELCEEEGRGGTRGVRPLRMRSRSSYSRSDNR